MICICEKDDHVLLFNFNSYEYYMLVEILECTTRRHNCSSEDYCREVRGSFECFCPDGLIGNGTIEGGGCQPKQRYNVFTKVAIGKQKYAHLGFIFLFLLFNVCVICPYMLN